MTLSIKHDTRVYPCTQDSFSLWLKRQLADHISSLSFGDHTIVIFRYWKTDAIVTRNVTVKHI